jgi:hypothetical protein
MRRLPLFPEGRSFATGKRIILQFILLEKYSSINFHFLLGGRIMKGRPKPDLRNEAKEWAEQMGYHWAENRDPSIPFDGFLYRDSMMIALIIKKLRYGLDNACIIEKKFPDDIMNLRNLPVPPYILRELWVRTQNERAYRRFYIAPDMTAEIEEVTRDNYRNTHYREAYWKNAPYRIDIYRQKEE